MAIVDEWDKGGIDVGEGGPLDCNGGAIVVAVDADAAGMITDGDDRDGNESESAASVCGSWDGVLFTIVDCML